VTEPEHTYAPAVGDSVTASSDTNIYKVWRMYACHVLIHLITENVGIVYVFRYSATASSDTNMHTFYVSSDTNIFRYIECMHTIYTNVWKMYA
jgi:hypothetical protein